MILGKSFDESSPLFLQIKDRIEDLIMNNGLIEDEQIPSTTQIVQFYKINHITVSKGVNLLVDSGVLYKKRGVGIFVSVGAREKLLKKRQEKFVDEFIVPVCEEAVKLGLTFDNIVKMMEDEMK